MKLIGYTGNKQKATLTHVSANDKKVHFVIGDASVEYGFEGEPVKAKLLATVEIGTDGTVTVPGLTSKAKDAVKQKSSGTTSGCAHSAKY